MKKTPITTHKILAAIVLPLALACATKAGAADITKANNVTALNAGGSWAGGVVPGATSRAIWTNIDTAAATPASLGGNLTWEGIEVVNPTVPQAITQGGAFALTLNPGGALTADIDMSTAETAASDFTNFATLTLTGVGSGSTFNVASGRTLTLNGAITTPVLGNDIITLGGGTVVLNGTNALGGNSGQTIRINGGVTETGPFSQTTGNGGNTLVVGGVSGTPAVFMNSGNTTIGAGSGTTVSIGLNGGTGTLNSQPGGILNLTMNAGTVTDIGGAGSTGALVIDGGIVTRASGDPVYLGDGGTGTLNLNGGIFSCSTLGSHSGGTGTAFFNGGILKPYNAQVNFVSGLGAYVSAGGLVVDENGLISTFPAFLATDTATPSPGGGVTVYGANAGGGVGTSGGLVLDPSLTETYTGPTIVNGGGLTLSYSRLAAYGSGVVTAGSPLVFGSNYLGGGALTVSSAAAAGTAVQTFGGLSLPGGGNEISNVLSSATSSTIALGAITRAPLGGSVDFNGTALASSTPITTTTANNADGILGGFATVANQDWAMNSSGDIVPYAAYTTLPATGSSATGNYVSAGTTLTASESANSLKLTAGTVALGANTLTLGSVTGGLLVTGGTNIITQTGAGTITAGAGKELIMYVARGATLTAHGPVFTGTGSLTKTGPGTWGIDTAGGPGPAFSGSFIIHQGLVTGNVTSFTPTNLMIDAGASLTFSSSSIVIGANAATAIGGSGVLGGTGGGGEPLLSGNVTVYPGGVGIPGTFYLGQGPGNNPVGTTIAISNGCKFVFDLSIDPANTNANDRIMIPYTSGPPSLPAALNITINELNGTLGDGAYTLFDAGANNGGLGATVPPVTFTFTNGPAPLSYTYAYTTGNKQLQLIVYNAVPLCTPPTAFNVTGGTGCSSSGVDVGVAGSQSGFKYRLFLGANPVGGVVTGSGSAITFGNQTAVGTYTVFGTNTTGGCSTEMTGSASVSQAPNTTYSVTGGGCSGSTPSVGLSSSDVGVTYQLLLNGSSVGSAIAGSGSAISFGTQTTPGTYTVEGTNSGCGIVDINGGSPSSVVVTLTPTAPLNPVATVGNNLVTVSWSAPASGAAQSYNLYRTAANGASGSETLYKTGVTSPYVDTGVANGNIYYYYVVAFNGACQGPDSTEVSATPNPPYSAYKITDSDNGNATAGVSDTLTVTAVDSSGNPVGGVAGLITLTFSGLANSPGGTAPTYNGAAASTTVRFTTGAAAVTLIPYDAQTAMVAVTDGTHSTASAGGLPLNLTVVPNVAAAYRITAATLTPAVGTSDTLTIHLVDQYENVETGFNGNKTLTFGGLNPGPDGTLPTVNGTGFGTGTLIALAGGSGTASLIPHKVESNRQLTATDGTLTATPPAGTAPLFSPIAGVAARLGINTQPSSPDPAGGAFGTQPVIQVCDIYLNPVISSASIDASAAVGVLGGTHPINAVNGVASFSGLLLTHAGTNTLTFTSSGLTPTNSVQIFIIPGPIVALSWVGQPGGAVYNTAFGTSPVLALVDQFGNPSTNGLASNTIVIVTLTSGPGKLSGNTNYNLGYLGSNGLATLTGLSINAVSNNFILTASTYLPATATLPVPGAAVWLDADDTNTIVGSPVTQWKDKSGNGHNFATPNGLGTITYANGSINGRPVVTFTNGAGLLTANGNYTFNGVSMTLFCVVRHSGDPFSDFEGPFSSTSGPGSNDWNNVGSWSIDSNAGSSPSARYQRYGLPVASPTTLAPQSPFIWQGAYDGDAGYEYVGYDDGSVSNITSTEGPLDPDTPFAIEQLSVGARLLGTDETTNGWDGDVAEIILYDSFLSTNEEAEVFSYLYNKWLGPGTPTGVSTLVFSVGPAPATVTGITANNKVYDGTTNATLTIGHLGLTGVFPQDSGNVSLHTNQIAGFFANPGPGDDIPVTVTGITLTGSAAGNYFVSLPLSANITPAAVAQGPLQIVVSSGAVHLTVNGPDGAYFILQRSTNLNAGAGWVSIATNTIGASGGVAVTDTFPDIANPPPAAAYYRLFTP